ncbi:tail fiber protein [Tistrella mobilis]|uniref:phage tail protein n=1 Tax=Tistrella mobilis TaxID=171437 RepID=UPI003558F079
MTLPLGSILAYAGSALPDGWAFAHGQILAIADHPDLFAVIGTTYGGDGVETFALPDLRGRRWTGADAASHPAGATGGAETVTLTVDHLPPHDHKVTQDLALSLPYAGSAATLSRPGPARIPAAGRVRIGSGPVARTFPVEIYGTVQTGRFIQPAIIGDGIGTGPAGGTEPLPLATPALALNAIIRIAA